MPFTKGMDVNVERLLNELEERLRKESAHASPAHTNEARGAGPRSAIEELFRAWEREMFTYRREQCAARPLTPKELTAVSLATVRESTRPRRWPTEMIANLLRNGCPAALSNESSPRPEVAGSSVFWSGLCSERSAWRSACSGCDLRAVSGLLWTRRCSASAPGL